MTKKNKTQKPKSLGKYILSKCDTDTWRAGGERGYKNFKIDSKMLSLFGRESLLQQIAQLEKEGILKPHWIDMGYDVDVIKFPIEKMPELYKRERMENPREVILACRRTIEKRKVALDEQDEYSEWLRKYYTDIINKLDQGKVPANARDKLLLTCLDRIATIREPIWERQFSADILGNSKQFRAKYRSKVATVLRHYTQFGENMKTDEILRFYNIFNFSYTLQWKGPLQFCLDDGKVIDSSTMRYGFVLNTQSLMHAKCISLKGIKRIWVIENQMNYEAKMYSDEDLYIFCHGYFSPLEVVFLKQLEQIADPSIAFYHWGDMDYGGIQIFRFVKKEVFGKIKPYLMDKETYLKEIKDKPSIVLSDSTRKKLEEIDAEELTELKMCILETGYVLEQENVDE